MKLARIVKAASAPALALAVGVAFFAITTASSANAASPFTADDAASRVSSLVPGGHDVQTTLVADPDGKHRHYRVTTDVAVGNVDPESGRVTTLVVLPAVPASTDTVVTQKDAIAKAELYANAHGLRVAGKAVKAKLIDHGSYKEWLVSWQRRVNGALAPEMTEVSINPVSGEVFSYVDTGVTFDAPASPNLTADQAAAAAQAHLGWAKASIVSSDLVVGFAPDGTQELHWQIVLTTTNKGMPEVARVSVNAMDGSVTDLGRG